MNLMYRLQREKFRQNPELLEQITERGGLAFLEASEHTVGVMGSRWEGKGSESHFIKVLKKAYENSITAREKPALPEKREHGISFEEDQTSGYKQRTVKNASADATIALATDFGSAGEKLTKRSVLEQGKKYIPIDANSLDVSETIVEQIVRMLNEAKAKTLNIAGNGIYTMKGKHSQDQVDEFTFALLGKVLNHPKLETRIESIRTGGQTGFDEAGAKAGVRLGLPTKILAPRGWKFRDSSGRDISDKLQFMARFEQVKPDQNEHGKTHVLIANNLINTKGSPYESRGVNVLRKTDTDEHFGNPFNSRGFGKVKTTTVAEAVQRFVDWLKGISDQNIEPKRRQWIIDQIKSGNLDGQPLLYYKDIGEKSHADALAELANDKSWQTPSINTPPATVGTTPIHGKETFMSSIDKVRIHQMATTNRTYDAITVVIGGLHMSCDLMNDRQIRQAKSLADSAGLELEMDPRLEVQVNKAIASMPPAEQGKRPTLAVIVHGGSVQHIVSDQPDMVKFRDVLVIDYDTEGADEDKLSHILRTNGEAQEAVISSLDVEQAQIEFESIVPLADHSPS